MIIRKKRRGARGERRLTGSPRGDFELKNYQRHDYQKKLANLEAAIPLFIGYYNFCWRPGKMRITPAMAAKVTDSFWSFGDFIAALENAPA
jgi:hypothetical protein